MKAYVLNAVDQLDYCEVKKPPCLPGWAVIKVQAAGICSSDIPRIYKKGTYKFPTIPGHEFSGIVENVYDKRDEKLIGKRVGVFPLIPCMKCNSCKQHHYETCDNYDYIGSRRDGAFAEYVAASIWNLIELPENVTFTQAAMLEPLAVALHSINQFSSLQNKNIAIVGTGMIGIAAGQWALHNGAATVTIIGHSIHKAEIVTQIPGLLYKYADDDKEYDCVLEAVGSNESIEKAISLTKAFGELVLLGNPNSDLCLNQNTYWRILRKQLCIKGSWNSYFEHDKECEWRTVVDSLNRREINVDPLITHTFNQDNLIEGLELMRDKKELYCKVMTSWNQEI